jgi:iron complex outermembrane receptor protein
MNGTNEIITVQQANNTFASQNAGATRHKGVEYGLTYRPTTDIYLRLSGTNALHKFVNYVESGINYSGYEMQTAPHFIGNAEIMYKPHFIKGFRIGVEEQKVGKYYLDNLEKYTYGGYSVTSIRTGYQWGPAEIWLNALNVFNTYYATRGAKSAYGYTYSLGDPRAFTLGLAYHFGR